MWEDPGIKQINEERGVTPNITTALGMIMQDVALLEYEYMP
jgi:hypothetical protein